MKKRVYIDFDGTIVNCRNRLYGLFSALISPKTIEESLYWSLRSSGATQKNILQTQFGFSDSDSKNFSKLWLSEIEKQNWLDKDLPRCCAPEILALLFEKYDLVLVTHRQKRKPLLQEVERFGWKNYFSNILVTEQKQSKADLIRSIYTGSGVLVGDTCEDVRTAYSLSMPSVAVRSEFESWAQVISYKPTVQINELHELPYALSILLGE